MMTTLMTTFSMMGKNGNVMVVEQSFCFVLQDNVMLTVVLVG
jgi:hypothetical protein